MDANSNLLLAVELSQTPGGIWFATCPTKFAPNMGMGRSRSEALQDLYKQNALLIHSYIDEIVSRGEFDHHSAMLIYKAATRAMSIHSPLDGNFEGYVLESVYSLAKDLKPKATKETEVE